MGLNHDYHSNVGPPDYHWDSGTRSGEPAGARVYFSSGHRLRSGSARGESVVCTAACCGSLRTIQTKLTDAKTHFDGVMSWLSLLGKQVGRVESRRPATVGPAYLLPPLSFGGASLAAPWSR